MNNNKVFEQTNIKRNLKRKMRDFRNVEFWVKHFHTYN